MKDILIFEPNNERARRLIFLLRLAGVNCTLARSIEETINCLSALHLNVISFDMLLLGSTDGMTLNDQLYLEVSKLTTIPIVFAPADGVVLSDPVPDTVVICEPDGFLSCIKQLLNIEDYSNETG